MRSSFVARRCERGRLEHAAARNRDGDAPDAECCVSGEHGHGPVETPTQWIVVWRYREHGHQRSAHDTLMSRSTRAVPRRAGSRTPIEVIHVSDENGVLHHWRPTSVESVRVPRRHCGAWSRLSVARACGVILIATVTGTPVGAQVVPALESAPSALTLDSVYALVARRSPRVQAAKALARAADARVPGARRPPDPELQLGFMNYSLPSLQPDEALGMVQLQLMQMLPIPGKLSAAGRAARARADAVHARASDALWTARSAAAMAFYERYQFDGALTIARQTRRLLEDVAAVSTAMYRVGDGRQADVLRARVEIARMDEEIVRMEAMLEGASARLAAAADTSPDAVAGRSVLPSFPDEVPSVETLVPAASETQPMLAAGAADVRAAAADVILARRELWPDLQLGVQYGQRRMPMGIDRMGSLMAGASLPVFARSRQLRMRQESVAMRAMAEAELIAMRADTRSRLTEVRAALTSARRLRVLYRSSILPQAEAATTSSLSSYRTGGVDFMTVIDNRMAVNRYRQELLALDAAEGRAWAELEMIVGRPLVGVPPISPRRIPPPRDGGYR